jgi:hypothetical protein
MTQYESKFGGAKRDRTADLLRARQALSQLSYSPFLVTDKSNLNNQIIIYRKDYTLVYFFT